MGREGDNGTMNSAMEGREGDVNLVLGDSRDAEPCCGDNGRET